MWDIKQVLELGSGTGVGALPLGISSSKLPNLREVVISDHMPDLKILQEKNINLQKYDHQYFRTEIIDWTQSNNFYNLGISPNLILATDVVFDGSPYEDFVKVCQQLSTSNQNLKVLVIMPTDDRKCSAHFIDLMEGSNFSHKKIFYFLILGY